MDDRHPALENSSPLEPFIDRFVKELVQERIDEPVEVTRVDVACETRREPAVVPGRAATARSIN